MVVTTPLHTPFREHARGAKKRYSPKPEKAVPSASIARCCGDLFADHFIWPGRDRTEPFRGVKRFSPGALFLRDSGGSPTSGSTSGRVAAGLCPAGRGHVPRVGAES